MKQVYQFLEAARQNGYLFELFEALGMLDE